MRWVAALALLFVAGSAWAAGDAITTECKPPDYCGALLEIIDPEIRAMLCYDPKTTHWVECAPEEKEPSCDKQIADKVRELVKVGPFFDRELMNLVAVCKD